MSSLVRTSKSRERSRTEGNEETHVKNYTLNITKPLYKKLEATKRNLSIEYKHTAGGIVLTADAVTFGLLRLATLNYFENLPEIKGQANIRKITDKSQTTIVQHIIKVALNSNSYTINIYNTTSRLLINGTDANQFLANNINSIHEIILKGLQEQGVKGLNTEELNRRLRNQLQNLLDNNDLAKGRRMNEQLNTDSKETCTKCNKRCRTRSTYCDTGNHWNSNGEDYYECKMCCECLLALKSCAQSNTHAQQLLEEETELLKVCNKGETSTNSQPEENCAVCEIMLIDPAWDICEDCNNKCHIKCMTEINGTYVCLPCIILQEELKQRENINKDLAIVTPHRNIEGKNQETTLLNESTPLATTKPLP
ncbi:unnamed protein product [Mytilus coruscus]|uniref:Uncharacterized protein n=1 Tax=Mytilus coruscus TaxID=42192 RepID=A0A6J8AVZ0_MYTCO|nr:unnamed protein product [Mytilus coruscus]